MLIHSEHFQKKIKENWWFQNLKAFFVRTGAALARETLLQLQFDITVREWKWNKMHIFLKFRKTRVELKEDVTQFIIAYNLLFFFNINFIYFCLFLSSICFGTSDMSLKNTKCLFKSNMIPKKPTCFGKTRHASKSFDIFRKIWNIS